MSSVLDTLYEVLIRLNKTYICICIQMDITTPHQSTIEIRYPYSDDITKAFDFQIEHNELLEYVIRTSKDTKLKINEN